MKILGQLRKQLFAICCIGFIISSFTGHSQQIDNIEGLKITVFEGQRFSITWDQHPTASDTLIIKFGNTKGGGEYGTYKVSLSQKRSERIVSATLTNETLNLFASYYVKTALGQVSNTFETVYKKSDLQDRELAIVKEHVAISTCLSEDKAYVYLKISQIQQVKIEVLSSSNAVLLTGYDGTVSETGIIDFSIASLPSGIYTVLIKIGTKAVTRKIVK